jgi:hypothetical protein
MTSFADVARRGLREVLWRGAFVEFCMILRNGKKTRMGVALGLNHVQEAKPVQESFLFAATRSMKSFLFPRRARETKPEEGPSTEHPAGADPTACCATERDRHAFQKIEPACHLIPSLAHHHHHNPDPTSFWPLCPRTRFFAPARKTHRAPAPPALDPSGSPARPHRILLPSPPPSRRPDHDTLARPGSIRAVDRLPTSIRW